MTVLKTRRIAVICAFLSSMGITSLMPEKLHAESLPETIKEIKPSIVGIGTIQATRTPKAKLSATGFIVGNGTIVATNAHVVSDSINGENNEQRVIFVGTGQNPEIRYVKDILTNQEHDLALLKIDGKPLPALRLGDSDKVLEGHVYAFTGFPIGAVLGLYPATHRAMVSAIAPIVIPVNQSSQLNTKLIHMLRSPFKIFQLDGTAYPGNSGSPLYDPQSGEVFALINMVFVKEGRENVLSNPSGISFAIPINYLTELLSNNENFIIGH